jgi:hypothetical protein
MMELAERLAALSTLSTAQLRVEWQDVHGEAAPAAFGIDLLARGIAWRLQEQAQGGLSASAARQLAQAARQIEKRGRASETTVVLRPGTRLARDWHGRTHHVLVLDDGYHYQERRYRSLTAIAREITGAAWSGPRFFGLIRRVADRAEASDAAA